jgi:cysteine synthase A
MRVHGAELTIIPSYSGKMTEKLTKDMIEQARVIAENTGSYWTDQMRNTDQLWAYTRLAAEIWDQTSGHVDAFVQSVGTAASLRGVGAALRAYNPYRIVAVEPSESALLSGGPSGAHKIDGIGAGYVVPLWDKGIADEIIGVSTGEAKAMAYRLAREEGLLPFARSRACLRTVAASPSFGTSTFISIVSCGP